MQSSSLRSIRLTPVSLRFSTASSYFRLSLSMPRSSPLMIEFNVLTSSICCCTLSCLRRYSCCDLFSSSRSESRWVLESAWALISLAKALSLASDSFLKISTSLLRILIFSFISASACELAWIRFTYLFRSFFTTSYSALNSFSRLFTSLHFFERSRMVSSFTLSACRVSRSSRAARVASRALSSRWALSMAISLFWERSSVDHWTISASCFATSSNSLSSPTRFDFSIPSCFMKRARETSTSLRISSICTASAALSSWWLRNECSESRSCDLRVGRISLAPSAMWRFFRSRRRICSNSFFDCESESASRLMDSSTPLRCISQSSLSVLSSCSFERSVSRLRCRASTSICRCSIVFWCSSTFRTRLTFTSSASARFSACLPS
mmetsp:Transcript_29507/g.68495  ORF Transcript_29507/g.68495 Transcript_29507/m.68495 type:complete len:382 (-) Transcript_29507:999-2144(-)